MNKKHINELYQEIIEKSWNNNVDDYMKFVFQTAQKYEKNEDDIFNLVDLVLKKILSNLKNNIDIKRYDEIFLNLGIYSDQDAYNFTIGVIKTYYENEFKVDNKEYAVLDIMNTVVEQYKTKDTIKAPRIFHYMLACLFRIHYALYVRE